MSDPYEIWCPACGCIMALRKGKYGNFMGCTGYPHCRNTMSLRDAQLKLTDDLGESDWEGVYDGIYGEEPH